MVYSFTVINTHKVKWYIVRIQGFQQASSSCRSAMIHSAVLQQVGKAWEPPGLLATRTQLLDDIVDRMVAIF